MAGVNIANAGLQYINYLLDDARETLNHESKARSLVKKGKKWTGSHLEGRLHVQRSGALNASEDGGAMPTPNKQTYAPFKSYRKFVHGSIQLTDGAMAAVKKPNAARDAVSSEVKGMMRDILKWENGMFTRDGSGSVGQFIGTDITSAATDVPVTDARMLWEGATYDVYDNNTGAVVETAGSMTPTGSSRGTVTVSSVESAPDSNGDFLVNFDATLAAVEAADHIVWKDSLNRCVTGLDKLIDDSATTFQGVNVATYPRYSSMVLDNSGTKRDLTPRLFRQMLAGIYQKTGRLASGLKVLTNSWQAIEVEELYEGELRLAPNTKVAGIEIASFQSSLGRVDIITDSDAMYHKIFFCDFSQISPSVQRELGWRRQGGSIFLRNDNSAVWTATALEIAELYVEERHSSGKINDLNEDAATSFG